jgi:hypothetical protein
VFDESDYIRDFCTVEYVQKLIACETVSFANQIIFDLPRMRSSTGGEFSKRSCSLFKPEVLGYDECLSLMLFKCTMSFRFYTFCKKYSESSISLKLDLLLLKLRTESKLGIVLFFRGNLVI